jgi:cellulose synthase/poly-beta-1,6-N-acetylglucosamine synthase-like glycosyltransferase/glycosyltransferase involved in cell wall biosynthesis
MNVFGLVSSVLLAIMLFWAIYHAWIIFAGLRSKRNSTFSCNNRNGDWLPKFSLIVPAKDESAVINRCLNTLMQLTYPKEKMELLVVAGASEDGTKEMCLDFSEKYPENVRVVCEDFSRGKPAALNLAFTHATGDIIGVFDADSVPAKDVLQRVASYFQDPSVSAVQGSAISLNESQNMLTKVAAAEDKAWFQGLLHGREKLGLFVAFTGSCQFIRSDVLNEIGGWEESALAEDVELSLKLVKHGRCVKFAPDVSSGQETPFNFRGLITQRTRWYRGYMEASVKYGSLLDHVDRRVIDAELSLIGPFVMIVCLASYVNWGFSVFFAPEASLFPLSASLAVVLTSLTLISLGVSMAFFEKPIKLRNVLWIPFIYGYWFVQMFIAFWAFLQFVFRRQKIWGKTVKGGFVKANFAPTSSMSSFSGLSKLSSLNVCFVSSYPPNHARLSEYAKNLVTALGKRPAIGRIHLLADKTVSSKETLGESSKTNVLRVWKPDDPFSILGIMFYLFKLKPDVVHFNVSFKNYGHGRVSNFAGLFLIFLCRAFGFKVLVEAHALGEKFDLEKAQLKPSFLNRVGIMLGTKLILSAPKVVVTVRSYVDYLTERYGHHGVQYIPHGTLDGFSSAFAPQTGEKVVLIFGHMGPYKGLPVMLKAFEELQKERGDVRLVVAGSSHPSYGDYLGEFIRARLPKVDFLGYIPEENLEQIFLSADVVVLPYLAAPGTSGVFHLACGYGRPIVASNLPELKEPVVDGASVLLVPPGDVTALKDAILKVLNDEKLAKEMSAQNMKFARQETWALVAESYEKAYLELSVN